MNKRKRASSSTSRTARGGSSRPQRGRNVSRVTKSTGTPDPGIRPTPPVQEPAPTTFTLSAECMVSEAAALKEHLTPLLEEQLPVKLDVSALQRIDTAGLQVLTAFVRERTSHGREVEWQGTAPVLVTAAQLLGLTSLLKLPA
jgi:ABC-type transporter Mla MlaB component